MKRFLLALMLIALPLAAQEEKKAEAKPAITVQKLFLLKYAEPANVYQLLRVFRGSTFIPNNDLRTLAVDATPESMAVIEDAIKRLDIPASAPTNVDMMVYLVEGHQGENPAGTAALPKELDAVVTQLKNAFAFKNFSLTDILTLRTRTGQPVSMTSSGGSLQLPGGNSQPIVTNFEIRSASIGSDGATVRIDGLRSATKVPIPNGNNITYQDLGIKTDIDIKEGQKVVVGRLGISKDQALFLVMTVKIAP